VIYGPGEPIPPRDVDYLVIHAHPDDETIDFGALIARLSASGKTGAVILLTDGSSGRDQYPWRLTGENYPPWDLSGTALADVRIKEAQQAMRELGVSLYLRLGLQNHPYNSITEELTPETVRAIWNQTLPVVDTLVEAIDTLRPELILSPDTAGFAREHFEHDATGWLVDQAVQRVVAEPTSPILAHIRAIDPYQTEGYTDLVSVPAWTPAIDGSIPRLVQLSALLDHRTQRDATVIAFEDRYPLEYDTVRATLFTRADVLAEWLGAGLARALTGALPNG
jgi:LmbE family N-acetylglucosaminyl deacetylase